MAVKEIKKPTSVTFRLDARNEELMLNFPFSFWEFFYVTSTAMVVMAKLHNGKPNKQRLSYRGQMKLQRVLQMP